MNTKRINYGTLGGRPILKSNLAGYYIEDEYGHVIVSGFTLYHLKEGYAALKQAGLV